MLYNYTDKLPPFIKTVGRVGWFIPRDNSQNTVTFISDVIDHGDELALAVRFILADIQSQENEESQQLAEVMFAHLVKQYPVNYRLHYNFLEVLNGLGSNEELLSAYKFNLPGWLQQEVTNFRTLLSDAWSRSH